MHSTSSVQKWKAELDKLRMECLTEPPPYPEEWSTQEEAVDIDSEEIVAYLQALKEHHARTSSWWAWIPIWAVQNTILLPLMWFLVALIYEGESWWDTQRGSFCISVLLFPFILMLMFFIKALRLLHKNRKKVIVMGLCSLTYALFYFEGIRRLLLMYSRDTIDMSYWSLLLFGPYIFTGVFFANLGGIRFAWWRKENLHNCENHKKLVKLINDI